MAKGKHRTKTKYLPKRRVVIAERRIENPGSNMIHEMLPEYYIGQLSK